MTKHDLEQIRRYFLEKGIKDTDLKKGNPLDGTEIWGVVQDGRSVQISMKDISVFLKPLLESNDSLFCGFHTSLEILQSLYPTAKEACYAWVLTEAFPEYPGEVFVYDVMHGWSATGVKASDSTKVELDDYIKSKEVEEIASLPDYTASRAIMDGSGNVIEDTYVRRDELIKGSIKGDSYLVSHNTYVFTINKQGMQTPQRLAMTLKAISGTGYVRDTKGMFVISGVSALGAETLIGASEELSHEFAMDVSVTPYKYIKTRIYQDLNRTILIDEKDLPVVYDGIDGQDGTNGTNGTNGTDGTDGADGTNGKDGLTPFIGENGHWWIGDQDTGVPAQGPPGETGSFDGYISGNMVNVAMNNTTYTLNAALDILFKQKATFKTVGTISSTSNLGYQYGIIELDQPNSEYKLVLKFGNSGNTGTGRGTFSFPGTAFASMPMCLQINTIRDDSGSKGSAYVYNVSATKFNYIIDNYDGKYYFYWLAIGLTRK